MDFTFNTTNEPSESETALLMQGLNLHAVDNLEQDGFVPIAIFMKDTSGEIAGGVSAYLNWNWLQVSLLWVDETLRGQGFGKSLMEKVEAAGRQHGCANAHVGTFSFQAKDFYVALGYEVFATLDDYPPGHSRHFLKKAL